MLELLTALVVTSATTWLIVRFGSRLGLVDTPNHRSMHTAPIPRSGGIACMVGFAAGVAAAAMQHRQIPWSMLAIALALGLVGLGDDRWSLRPLYRLVAQMLAGAAAGIVVGGGWWIMLGIIVLPTAVNVINFMDGINGITALSMIVWGAAVAIAASHWTSMSLGLIGLLVIGAAAGFLPWNAPNAKIFMGDGGSYVFGGLVGAGSMIGAHGGVPIGVLVGPMVIYLADTGSVLVRRLLTHQPLFEPHRTHVYQRLVTKSGWPHIAISSGVAACSACISAAWLSGIWWLGATVTAAIVTLYLISPALVPSAPHPNDKDATPAPERRTP